MAYLGEQMKAHGYVYRRPKHDLRVHQDPGARAEAEARLVELKKAEQGDFVLLFVDKAR